MRAKKLSERKKEFDDLADRVARARRQFVAVELQTCQTTLEMGEFELSVGNSEVAEKELSAAKRAIGTIEQFLPGVGVEHVAGLRARLAEVQSGLRDLKSKLRSRRARPAG